AIPAPAKRPSFWADDTFITIRTGKYNVVGYSTAGGSSIQDKCSIIFNEPIEISIASSTISLNGIYDCSLIIFNDSKIESLHNSDGENHTSFFSFNTYKYAFVKDYLYIPSHKNKAYILGKYTNGAEFQIFTGNLNFSKGKYYVYNSVDNDFNLPPMEDGTGEIVSLSQHETANSYIAPLNSKCSFSASVKGNSTTSIGMPKSATVVWETLNTSIQPNVGDVVKNVYIANGVIYFETTDNRGNALIAATDEVGNILWSWHIWATDYNPNAEFDTYPGFENLKVMNRNLGALSNRGKTDAVGMVYQWGRKEPFSGYGMVFTSEMKTITTSSKIGTEEYATTHPTTFILALSQGGDWRYNSNSSAWGSTKTQLDPCPPGWKVPEGGEAGLFKDFKLGVFDNENKGMIFKDINGASNIYMPAQGYLADSQSFRDGWWQVDYEGRYWTTSVSGSSSHYFSFDFEKICNQAEFTHSSRANGHAIRCVEDK
ncbi:MAG: hypothetical protein IIV29_04365, partial [Tidjanibacter sp.]|nr:hypothetical protein [Tidjanibacter sp.]